MAAAFCKNTGRLVSLVLDGKEMIAWGMGFVYDNHRWIENDRFTDIDPQLDDTGTCTWKRKNGAVVVETYRGGKLCSTTIIYTFYPQRVIDMDVRLSPQATELRRAGLVCMLDSSLNRVDYYAFGPWENYIGRKNGCFVGRYQTRVGEMASEYPKPQSMGNREGMHELALTDTDGRGIHIETEGNVSFSTLRYTDADLMDSKHIWELRKRPYIVMHLDSRVRGVGNGSCGQDVDTMEKYRIHQKAQSYRLRISTTSDIQ